GRILAVVFGAEQAAFLAGEGHEDEATTFAILHLSEMAGEFEDGRRAGAVVVGAMVNRLGVLVPGEAAAAATAVAEVIVVSADDDSFIGMVARSLEDSNNVLDRGFLAAHVNFQAGRPAVDLRATRSQ